MIASIPCVLMATGSAPGAARAEDLTILSDDPGFGQMKAQERDLLLIHYKAYVGDTVFDSTIGDGLRYRDGGRGVTRPAIVRLSRDSPVPGITEGLQMGLTGMAIGGKRVFTVPPQLGFGSQTVLAPYAVVPANSTLRYEVQLLRLSRTGPDNLTAGIVQCGQGGAGQQTAGCGKITFAEF